jgi:diguanylate cyclase (GGDEF)-like protein
VSSVVLLAALLWEAHQLYPLLAAANEELYWASVKDGLTGLFNRRYFMTQLEAELARAHRLDQPVSLLMGDVDHFKQCNDKYGHQCGDAVLTNVAEVFLHHAHRPGDFAVRYGGEEVALVLVGALREGAFEIAEQIRNQVAELRFRDQAKPCAPEGITVSIGIATAEPGSSGTAEKLIAAADRALYQAKQFGRNRVCIGHDAALKGRENIAAGAVTRIRQ